MSPKKYDNGGGAPVGEMQRDPAPRQHGAEERGPHAGKQVALRLPTLRRPQHGADGDRRPRPERRRASPVRARTEKGRAEKEKEWLRSPPPDNTIGAHGPNPRPPRQGTGKGVAE